MTDSTVIVSIGRGLPSGGELTEASWTDFQADALSALVSSGQLVFQGSGVGTWTDPETSETTTEDAWTGIALVSYSRWSNTIARLRDRLVTLATVYGQDAIAFTLTDDTEILTASAGEPF